MLVAEGAGLEVEHLVNSSVPLVLIRGLVTTVTAFFSYAGMKLGRLSLNRSDDDTCNTPEKKFAAAGSPVPQL